MLWVNSEQGLARNSPAKPPMTLPSPILRNFLTSAIQAALSISPTDEAHLQAHRAWTTHCLAWQSLKALER